MIAQAAQDTRSAYDGVAAIYLWVGGAVFVLVTVATLFMVVRYRARGDRRPGRTHDAPRVEIAYAAVLVAITAALIVVTFTAQDRIDALTPAESASPPLQVDVVAAQWRWRFVYPGDPPVAQEAPEGTPSELILPAGRKVLFTGRSQDVLHDFWIPDLRFQRQVWPDHVERWGLVFPRPGVYMGVCAWFCGLRHADMHFVARALAPDAFDAWLARRRAEGRR